MYILGEEEKEEDEEKKEKKEKESPQFLLKRRKTNREAGIETKQRAYSFNSSDAVSVRGPGREGKGDSDGE